MRISVEQLLKWKAAQGATYIGITPEQTCQVALEIMTNKNISALVVVNQNQALLGLISERDILRKVYLARIDPNTVVSEVMTPFDKLVCISPHNDSTECAQIIIASHVRHIPVIDPEGVLLGILSIRDVVKGLNVHLAGLAGSFEAAELTRT